jgi:ACS family D-galactonate transporter-like MFS transporter
VVILLVLSVSINYIDRGNLSIAAPLIKDELGISASQLGILLSSFFWTYAAFQIPCGWLVDRFEVNWVLAVGFFLWSVATAATGLIHGFAMLLALRLLLGIGESVAYPCYSKILAAHFHEHQRGLPNALIDAGTKCGPALGTLVGGIFMAHFGWRPFFIALGLGSLFWLPGWLKWMPRGPGLAAGHPGGIPSIPDILRQRSAWATFFGLFCSNYFWYFLLTWLPFYLVRERHLSMDRMATIGALAYFVVAGSHLICGKLSDRWIASGGTPTRVRKTFLSFGLAFTTVIVPASLVSDRKLSMTLLLVTCMMFGLVSPSLYSITQTLAGPLAVGKWTGLQSFVGNLAGVVAPALTGLVVQRTGQFFWAFVLASGVAITGAMVWVFVVGPVEPVNWKVRASVQT